MRPLLLLPCSLVLAACAREPRNPAVIVPYQDGLIVSSAMARTEQDALRHAVRGAEMECERRGGPLAVTRTTTHFRGVVSREVTETVSKIGEVVNSQAGPVMPDLSTDEDYKVNVEFRCGAAGR